MQDNQALVYETKVFEALVYESQRYTRTLGIRSDYRGGRPAAGEHVMFLPRPARGTAFPKVATLSAMLPLPRNVLFSPIVVFAMVTCYHSR